MIQSNTFGSIEIQINTILSDSTQFPVILDARRAVFIPALCTLLVSDLHWGKSETFQQFGIPIPDTLITADLQRLSQLLTDYQPDSLFILGDLIHGQQGITPSLHQRILAWRKAYKIPMILIAGNHDRAIHSFAKDWDITVVEETLKLESFVFSHEPLINPGPLFNWCGHIHPTVFLQSASDKLRLPCFHIQKHQGIMPAFSAFTGGQNIKASFGDQIFALTDDEIFPFHCPSKV